MAKSQRNDPVSAYAKAVIAGKVLAGDPVQRACARHLADLKRKDLVWRADQAAQALSFFPDLLKLESGQPFELMPFQKFIVGSIFGWYGMDGYRRFRTAYVEIGKGNGKTPLAAGIGLYGMIADDEPAAEIYSAAVTKDQAKLVWKDAEMMVEASPELSSLVKPQANLLTVPAEHSVFRPLSAEHKALDGKRVHMALIDELHEHPSAMVVDKMRAGTKTRKQALIFEITNSGFNRTSVCWHHHDYSIKVLEGTIKNDAWFAYVCALGAEDDWRDPKVWIKANPGIGKILPKKYLTEMVREAVGMPSKENIVRRLNFCEWTEQSVRWLPMPLWDKGAIPIDLEALKGRLCYGGLDLARVHDLSALGLIFPPIEEGEKWKLLLWYWLPADDMVLRSERDHVPYDVWVRDGLIKATPGNVTDFGFIQADILALAGVYDIREVAFDRIFAGEIIQNLRSEGMEMIDMGQGFLSMATPTAEFERLVRGELLQHGGHPVLRWNAGNVAVAQDAAGNIKPDKEHSFERIDGIPAGIMALDRAKRNEDGGSVYEERGVRTV